MGRVEGKDCGTVLINQVYFEKGTSNKNLKTQQRLNARSLVNCAQAEVTL